MTTAAQPAAGVDLAREPDFQLGVMQVSPSACRVMIGGEDQRVEPRVMEVLVVLARHAGHTVTRDQLIDACWGGRIVSDDAVTRAVAQVRNLARHAVPAPFVLETVPKVGFRLIAAGAAADPVAVKTRDVRRLPRAAAIGAAALGALVLAAALWMLLQAFPRPWTVEGYRLIANAEGVERSPSLSPDGRFLAYQATDAAAHGDGEYVPTDIVIRNIADGEPQKFTDTPELEMAPAWSRDGNQIAFVRSYPDAQHRPCEFIVKPFPAGPERRVGGCLEDARSYHLDWTADDKGLVFSDGTTDHPTRIRRLDLATGAVRDLTAPPPRVNDHNATISPDGRTLAFVRYRAYDVGDVFTLDLRTGGLRQLTHDGVKAWIAWAPDGRGLFITSARSGDFELWWAPLQQRSEPLRLVPGLRGIGRPAAAAGLLAIEINTVVSHLVRAGPGGEALTSGQRADTSPAFATDGSLAFLSRGDGLGVWIQRPNQAPRQLRRLDGINNADSLRWSPDGSRLALVGSERDRQLIYLLDAESGVLTPIRGTSHSPGTLDWTPDGRALVFTGQGRLFRIAASPTAQEDLVDAGGWYGVRQGPDGVYLTRLEQHGVWRLADDRRPVLVAGEGGGVFSQDLAISGDRLYVVDRRDRDRSRVLVRSLPGGAPAVAAPVPGIGVGGLAVDPRSGAIVYSQAVSDQWDIGLLKVRRATWPLMVR